MAGPIAAPASQPRRAVLDQADRALGAFLELEPQAAALRTQLRKNEAVLATQTREIMQHDAEVRARRTELAALEATVAAETQRLLDARAALLDAVEATHVQAVNASRGELRALEVLRDGVRRDLEQLRRGIQVAKAAS
jgi:hypothetical protein